MSAHNLGPGGTQQQHLIGPGGTQHLIGPGGTQRIPPLGPGGIQPLVPVFPASTCGGAVANLLATTSPSAANTTLYGAGGVGLGSVPEVAWSAPGTQHIMAAAAAASSRAPALVGPGGVPIPANQLVGPESLPPQANASGLSHPLSWAGFSSPSTAALAANTLVPVLGVRAPGASDVQAVNTLYQPTAPSTCAAGGGALGTCDFGSPYLCTTTQAQDYGSAPAWTLDGPTQACTLPAGFASDPPVCVQTTRGACGIMGGTVGSSPVCPLGGATTVNSFNWPFSAFSAADLRNFVLSTDEHAFPTTLPVLGAPSSYPPHPYHPAAAAAASWGPQLQLQPQPQPQPHPYAGAGATPRYAAAAAGPSAVPRAADVLQTLVKEVRVHNKSKRALSNVVATTPQTPAWAAGRFPTGFSLKPGKKTKLQMPAPIHGSRLQVAAAGESADKAFTAGEAHVSDVAADASDPQQLRSITSVANGLKTVISAKADGAGSKERGVPVFVVFIVVTDA